jgi:hypothetical protein
MRKGAVSSPCDGSWAGRPRSVTSSDRAAANRERRPDLVDLRARYGDGASGVEVLEHLRKGSVEAAAE